jgi:hypothetical protein
MVRFAVDGGSRGVLADGAARSAPARGERARGVAGRALRPGAARRGIVSRPGGPTSATVASAAGFCALAGVLLASASALPYGGLALVAVAPLVGRPASVPGPRLGPAARPLAAVFGAPALLVLPAVMMSEPVVQSAWRCGTPAVAAALMMPVLAFFVGLVAAAIGCVVAAIAGRRLARLARLAPIIAGAAMITVAVLCVAAGVRAARHPVAGAWAAALPVIGTLDPDAPAGDAVRACGAVVARVELPQGSRTVLVGCEPAVPGRSPGGLVGGRPSLVLGDPAGQPLADGPSHLDRITADRGAPVAIRVDARHGLVVVTQSGVVLGAMDGSSGELVDVPLRLVASEVAPPLGTIAAAVVGLLVAGARVRRARQERAAMRRVARGTEAMVDEAGWVAPSDGGDGFRPPGAPLPPGEAVVLGRPAAGPFRGGADRRAWVLPGARAEHVEAHRARATAFDLEAAAALALTAAPLVAAALLGLVL